VIMEALGRDLGVAWVRSADGMGWEIGGVDQGLMDFFASYSSHRGKPTPSARRPAPTAPPAPAAKPMSLKDEFKKMGWLD
jgi:hypothetical protein